MNDTLTAIRNPETWKAAREKPGSLSRHRINRLIAATRTGWVVLVGGDAPEVQHVAGLASRKELA